MFRLLIFLTLVCGMFGAISDRATAKYAVIVVDADNGRIIHAINAETKNYPASLTKIMTLFMTFEALKNGTLSLDQKLPVSRVAAGRSPSRLDLKKGDTITVDDAISALVTKSANDVATVLAEAMGGTERKFARLMTTRAREMGMKDTTFKNASGLPSRGQLSTATDMAILARALLDRFPNEYKYFSKSSFTWNGRAHKNHNKLLETYDGADGIKTGYIRASGFNLVASARRNGVRLIAVMFGGKSPRHRNKHVAEMLDQGFRAVTRVASAGKPAEETLTRAAVAATMPSPEENKPRRPTPPPAPKVAAALPGSSTVRRPADLNSWAIQVGAYNRYAPAHIAVTRAARAVPSLLGTRFAIVRQKSTRRRGPDIFKARLLVNTESRAHQSCQALKRRKIDCMVIWMGPANSSS